MQETSKFKQTYLDEKWESINLRQRALGRWNAYYINIENRLHGRSVTRDKKKSSE